MVNETNHQKQSALSKFKLGFEYNETWNQAIRDVRKRTVRT